MRISDWSSDVCSSDLRYMVAVREGRSSRAKKPNSPRTIKDKQAIYKRDIAPKLAKRIIYDVTEADLIKLVEAKGKTAKVRANRLAAELKVRSEEHTSELQSLMGNSYAVLFLKKKKDTQ